MPDNAYLPLSADPRAYRKVPNSDELAADVETTLNRTRHGCYRLSTAWHSRSMESKPSQTQIFIVRHCEILWS